MLNQLLQATHENINFNKNKKALKNFFRAFFIFDILNVIRNLRSYCYNCRSRRHGGGRVRRECVREKVLRQ